MMRKLFLTVRSTSKFKKSTEFDLFSKIGIYADTCRPQATEGCAKNGPFGPKLAMSAESRYIWACPEN